MSVYAKLFFVIAFVYFEKVDLSILEPCIWYTMLGDRSISLNAASATTVNAPVITARGTERSMEYK
jgi:hypothetical protein